MTQPGRPSISLGLKLDAPSPGSGPPGRLRRWVGRVYAAYLVLRTALLAAGVLATTVVVTSLVGGLIESTTTRLALGLAAALALPLVVRWRLQLVVSRRLRHRPRLGGVWFLVAWNAITLLVLCLGFSDATGRAMRRRGDWFLGETDGWLPRRYRRSLVTASAWMERFDLPPEAKVIAEAALPQDAPPPVYKEGKPLPPEQQPPQVAWFHPLVAPRTSPPNSACRFGAPRPGHRPRECELGHCGIDLVQPEGSPVFATFDGVVVQAVRDEARGGIAGCFVRLSHKEGAAFTSYVHLRDLRSDVRVGTKVRGGEMIGTLGRTGCRRGAAHLHFALAVKHGGGVRYIDPEPLVMGWRLPSLNGRGPLVAERGKNQPIGEGARPIIPTSEEPEDVPTTIDIDEGL